MCIGRVSVNNSLNADLEVSEFEHQSRYYVYFRN